jgi:hypothetical protein
MVILDALFNELCSCVPAVYLFTAKPSVHLTSTDFWRLQGIVETKWEKLGEGVSGQPGVWEVALLGELMILGPIQMKGRGGTGQTTFSKLLKLSK